MQKTISIAYRGRGHAATGDKPEPEQLSDLFDGIMGKVDPMAVKEIMPKARLKAIHHHSKTLEEFMNMTGDNLFPLWPKDKSLEPLFLTPPIDSEYLLPDTADEWTGTLVVGEFDATLYIFSNGCWYKLPKVAGTALPTEMHISEVVYSLSVKAKELYEALQGIIEIGKRNTENPKYDPYYDLAREVLAKYKQ
jgi:hypothetical protein